MLTYCNADVFRSRPHRKQGNVGANPAIGFNKQDYDHRDYHAIIYLQSFKPLTVFPVYLGLARRAALLRVQSRAAPSFRLGKRDYDNRDDQLFCFGN